MPKLFVGESFTVELVSGIGKVWIRGGYPEFLWKVFRLTVPKFSVRGSFVALMSGTEKVWIRGRGKSRFSVENFSSHSAENIRGGILYCCITFGNRKGFDRKGRELQGIPSNIFCLTVPKNFVRESFNVALIFR